MKEFKVPDWLEDYLHLIDTVLEEFLNKEFKTNDVRAALIYQCNAQIRLLVKLKEEGLLK